MNEPELVNSLDGKNTLGDVEPSNILRECVVLDEHRHQITSGKELHDEVQVCWVLERIVKLHHPWRVRLGKDVALGADVRELRARGSRPR